MGTCVHVVPNMLYCWFAFDVMTAMLEVRYNTKAYVINSIVGSSRRGWPTLSAISREIDCKPRIAVPGHRKVSKVYVLS